MNRHYQYLIVGGGMAADAAVRGIRDVDPNGAIGMIGEDPDPPYKRPWLSKGLWKGESLDRIWLKTADKGVEMHLGRRVERFDLAENRVQDDQGDSFRFDTLLMATGVRPRKLEPASDRVIAYRSLADFRRLLEISRAGHRFAVVGSGFVGTEIAAALTMAGKHVDLIYPESVIGSRMLPPDLARYVTDRYRGENVDLHPRTMIGKVIERGDRVLVDLVDLDGASVGRIEVDAVVTGIGSNPNDELALEAGLQAVNGIVVDRRLRTRRPNVYAVGDVARFFQPALRQYIRVEHEDNARKMGRAAGRAMAGDAEPYDHLPSFYSDLFDMGYEAVGEIDARYETVEDWHDPFRQGVLYYVRDKRVRGVLLWNVWGKIDDARQMIAAETPMAQISVSGGIALA